jgi:hypothetical protein
MKTIGTFAAAAMAGFLTLTPAWSATHHVYGTKIHGIIIHHCNYPGPIIHGIIIHKCRPLRGIIVTHPRKK